MNLFQTIFVPLCALIGLIVLARTLRHRLPLRYGVIWALLWTGAAVVIAVPTAATRVAGWFGIGRGADLVFYLAILAGLGASLFFYSRFRRLEIMLTEILRRDALLSPRHGPEKESVEPPSGSNVS